MGAYDHVTYNGVTLNRRTAAMLDEAEKRLGYTLTLYQGSYNAGAVGASSGTHDGGGAVDLAPADAARKVKVLRDIGFAAWHRLALPGEWVEHIHAIAIGDAQLAPLAASQVEGYKQGRDGLGPWPFGIDSSYRPHPIPTFDYAKWLKNLQGSEWDKGVVYLSKLQKGTRDSDSVRRLQTRLKKLDRIKTLFLGVNGDYGPKTQRAVKRYQKRYTTAGPSDGSFISPSQANHLFGPAYHIKD